MTKGWTEERRRKAAARCRANKPWKKSTDPKTPAGKMRASLNALKHGGHIRVHLWFNFLVIPTKR